jgi:hypothetical protein
MFIKYTQHSLQLCPLKYSDLNQGVKTVTQNLYFKFRY